MNFEPKCQGILAILQKGKEGVPFLIFSFRERLLGGRLGFFKVAIVQQECGEQQ
mgnify:CR=1 FL=1